MILLLAPLLLLLLLVVLALLYAILLWLARTIFIAPLKQALDPTRAIRESVRLPDPRAPFTPPFAGIIEVAREGSPFSGPTLRRRRVRRERSRRYRSRAF